MIRSECGSMAGALAHQAQGERWCGWCTHAERIAALTAEGIPSRPSPAPRPAPQPVRPYQPVTAEQAARNAARLDAETATLELDWVKEPGGGRHLRAVPAPGQAGAA